MEYLRYALGRGPTEPPGGDAVLIDSKGVESKKTEWSMEFSLADENSDWNLIRVIPTGFPGSIPVRAHESKFENGEYKGIAKMIQSFDGNAIVTINADRKMNKIRVCITSEDGAIQSSTLVPYRIYLEFHRIREFREILIFEK